MKCKYCSQNIDKGFFGGLMGDDGNNVCSACKDEEKKQIEENRAKMVKKKLFKGK